MGNPLVNLFKKMMGVEEENITQVNLDQKTAQSHKQLDRDRLLSKGKNQELKRQLEAQDEAPDKTDVTEYLHRQQQKKVYRNLANGVSLKRLFEINEKHDITLLSRDEQQDFGVFKDFAIGSKGMIYVLNQDGKPVTGGPTFGRILASPQGFLNEVDRKMLRLAVDKEGRHIKGPETQQVPQMVLTPDGDFAIAEDNMQMYQERVAELRQKVNQYAERNAVLERTVSDLIEERNQFERELEAIDEMDDALNTRIEKRLKDFRGALQDNAKLKEMVKRTSMEGQTWENVARDAKKQVDKISKDIVDDMDTDELDAAEAKIRKALHMFLSNAEDLNKLSDNQQQTQQQPQQENRPPEQPPAG